MTTATIIFILILGGECKLKNNEIIKKQVDTDEKIQSLANKIKVVQELVKDGIISEKEGLNIRKKLIF